MDQVKFHKIAIRKLQKEYERRYKKIQDFHEFYGDEITDHTYAWKFHDTKKNRLIEMMYDHRQKVIVHISSPITK